WGTDGKRPPPCKVIRDRGGHGVLERCPVRHPAVARARLALEERGGGRRVLPRASRPRGRLYGAGGRGCRGREPRDRDPHLPVARLPRVSAPARVARARAAAG